MDNSASIWIARDSAGSVAVALGAEPGRVDGILSAFDGQSTPAWRAVARRAADAPDLTAALDELRAAGLAVERVPADLLGVQVRISAAGHPFVPGHKGNVGLHGEIAGKISKAAQHAHEASKAAETAKHHAFLAEKAGTHQEAAAPPPSYRTGRACTST